MTEMKNLSALFSEKIRINADLYLTEEDFQSQRFLYAGIGQLRELAAMKRDGRFDFETVLLSEKETVTGFVLVERLQSGDPSLPDTGSGLVFTPAVSDVDTKREFWSVLGELTALPPTSDIPTRCLQISEKELAEDVTEYYSKMKTAFFKESGALLPPYDAVYSQNRVRKAVETIQTVSTLPIFKTGGRPFLEPDMNVLEICCGNGMSTLALYEKGIRPLCVDINAEDICIGLEHGVLKPEKTIVTDASVISRYLDSETYDTVIGFMIGTIYEFNKDLWFSIVDEALKMLKPDGFLMLTLRAEHEAVWIADYLKTQGIDGEIIDNRDEETNYDEWVYAARKQ